MPPSLWPKSAQGEIEEDEFVGYELQRRPSPPVGGETLLCVVSLSQDGTNPSNGNNAVPFDVADYDPHGMTNFGVGNGVIVPVGGMYIAHFHATLSSVGTNPAVGLYWGSANGAGTTRFAEGANPTITFHAAATGMRYIPEGLAIFASLGKSGGTQTIDFDSSFGECYMTVASVGAPFTPPSPLPG